jgi:LmbE family N-acetylglucosaminyl deacetylase
MVVTASFNRHHHLWNIGDINNSFTSQFLYLRTVIKMKKHIQVFSPHFDDAVLSVGQHILDWQKTGYQVDVITVFTEFKSKNLSADAQKILRESGAKSSSDLQKIRSKEDQQAMKILHPTQYQWLKCTDAAFREQSGQPVYASLEKLFSGVIKDDGDWINSLKSTISKVLKRESIIILPFGIGRHADHLIVRNVVQQLVPAERTRFYYDMPYSFELYNWQIPHILSFLEKNWTMKWSTRKKLEMVNIYQSQVPVLFRSGVWEYPEVVTGEDLVGK